MNRRPPVRAAAARGFAARLRGFALPVAILLGAPLARAGEPTKEDPLVNDSPWSVDVEATAKGISEAVALELDALSPADRAEELLRRETFLKALRLSAAANGTFVLDVEGQGARGTRGTWVAKGGGRYAFTIQARFGVRTSTADAGPFEAILEELPREGSGASTRDAYRLSYRDRDGTRLVFEQHAQGLHQRPEDPKPGAKPVPPPAPAAAPAPAPAPAPMPVPGSHPAAYVAAWELDRDRMVDVALALARKQLETLEPGQRKLAEALLDGDAARDRMRQQFEAMQIEVELRADGTLKATLGLPGRDVEDATGTWAETDGKVVLIVTTKDGKPATEADRKPVNGRLDGGILWLEMAGDASAIPLRKLVR